MGCTVHELLTRVSSAELTQWRAYAELEPFGFVMENWRAGVVATTVANAAPRKRGSRAFKVNDFMPSRKARVELTPDQQAAIDKKRTAKRKQKHG